MSVSRVGRRLMADEYRDWTTGLWGCGDCSLLCKAWWCPCRVYDYLATVLGCNTFGGQRQGQGQGGVSACCVYCIAPEPLRVYLLHDMRNKLRQSGNIKVGRSIWWRHMATSLVICCHGDKVCLFLCFQPVSNKCREMCLLFCCEPCVLRQMMRVRIIVYWFFVIYHTTLFIY